MTKERREDVVLVALVVSLAIHVGLMALVKPQVMTKISPVKASPKRVSISVPHKLPPSDPMSIKEVEDIAARKDAPTIATTKVVPTSAAPVVQNVETPNVNPPEPASPVLDLASSFATALEGVNSSDIKPITRIETPTPRSTFEKAPDFSIKISEPTKVVAVPTIRSAPEVFAPAKVEVARSNKPTYTPAETIYEKIEERVIEEEKTAVRDLMNAVEVTELDKFVNLTMSTCDSGGWRYFKVMITPRMKLKVIPKDVVIIIDGSGSIGNDRLNSCRNAARRIMRTAMNSGDRFNLVVFRNAFSYAFNRWQECDAKSFEAGDRWLSRQAAHGRTDVFSTISSVLTLPRDPARPIVALVVTDGDANYGVSSTAEILSQFTALNDGLVSVYMYGVKGSANRELIDVLTHGNRGESFIFDGWRWKAGEEMESLSSRFRDPVLSDLRVVFMSHTEAECYPRLLRNLQQNDVLEFVGRVPLKSKNVSFALRGLNGKDAYEGLFKLEFVSAAKDLSLEKAWLAEREIDKKLSKKKGN